MLTLSVNSSLRQSAPVQTMIWSPAEIIHHISTLHELNAGDVIFTGTPEGVGELEVGDEVVVKLEGGERAVECNFRIS